MATTSNNVSTTENIALSSAPSTPSMPSKNEQPDTIARGPPPLPYNLHEHKLMIFLFWFLILTECTLIPIIFYFTISNLTDLRPGAMFAIITAMFGFISGGEYGLRGLRLALKRDTYRPLNGAGRWSFDTVHLVLGPPYFVMTALMIGFSIPDPPMMRGLSIIMPVGILMVTTYMIWTGIAYHFGWRLRWHRLSSHVIGDKYPPLTFTIMEDITACDGGGGKEYREAAMARYNASPRFRRMLVEMLWAWAITGSVVSIVLIVLAWVLPVEVGYTLGWAVPSVWGAIGAWMTIKWGQRSLRIEKENWMKDHMPNA
ncbi:hypothetical protein FOXYS1_14459 [Fusarium oxysporum]|uniref:Uncharacterized protein n=1 Tax=Fusarium oxysporum TaxID=5507 RepID=A0A8H5EBK9_FUSOX|nr:hypothetical protein FOXYS1_14459 [Fusarium oxysporum]